MSKKKETWDRWMIYGLVFNIIILILTAVYAISGNNNENVFNTLEIFWYVSFGWIMGRASTK